MIFRAILFCCLLLSACTSTIPAGSVVQETIVTPAAIANFSEEDRRQLEHFKEIARQNQSASIGIDLKQTNHYTVQEYLDKYPEYRATSGVDYTVGGNDVLTIQVYDEEDLTREEIRVSQDGFITFPLVGRLQVEGLTPSQIQDLIANKLADGNYLLDAHVQVLIKHFGSKKYSVLGAVKKSGVHFLESRETILDGLSAASGVLQESAGKNILLIRTDQVDQQTRKTIITIPLEKLLKEADMVSNIHLKEKDVIYIPEAEQFHIMGQVNSPGSYSFTTQDMTLVEGISRAGGFTHTAARTKTRIIRVEGGVEKVITVNVDVITKQGQKIQDVTLRPGDIIIVPESFF